MPTVDEDGPEGPRRHRLAVLPGDGVGPELVEQALRVLAAVTELEGFEVDLAHFPHSGEHYRRTGELLGEEALAAIGRCESLLFGAAGDPLLPPGTMERALILGLSATLGLSVGDRPFFLYRSDLSPLKGLGRGDIDHVIVRNLSEGELAVPGGRAHAGRAHELTVGVEVHTRAAITVAVRRAFAMAAGRRGRLAVISQSNSLAAHRLWDEIAEEVATEFPEVTLEHSYPDTAAMRLVTDPTSFDVLVTTILLGGTLSSLAAATVGGIGLIGSSRLDPVSGFGMFEPAHGSAPVHAGRRTVSPVGTLRALAMLLVNVGEPSAGARVERAIDRAFLDAAISGGRSGPPGSTVAATDAVLARLED